MLGSLGRLADHIVLLRDVDGVLCASHYRPLRPDLAERRSLGRPAQRAAAGLRDRTDRSRRERARELPALSRLGALRARRPGADLRRAGAADALALGRRPGRRLRQRAQCAVQPSRHDLLGHRRGRAVARRDPQCARRAGRLPDRASEPGRRKIADAACDGTAVAAGSAPAAIRSPRRTSSGRLRASSAAAPAASSRSTAATAACGSASPRSATCCR